ncbi:MAG: tetratricopeptide repeat protein [Alphaproteobacteria bacterium]
MADIFREVDEEVRKDELARLWRRWGKAVIAVAVVVVLAAAGYSGWREWRESRRAAAAASFVTAGELASAGRHAEAAEAFAAMAEDAPGGFADLARLRSAQAYAAAGERAAALAAFDALVTDPDGEPFLQGIARFSGALLTVDDGDPAEVRTRLAPLLAPGSPLRAPARELEGLLALRTGDLAGAAAIFAELAGDADAPLGVRARAAELAASLGASGLQP